MPTEHPRVGSSILSLGTIPLKPAFNIAPLRQTSALESISG